MNPLVVAAVLALPGSELAVPAADPVSAEQFLRVIHSLHDGLRDVSLLYEGESTFVGPASILDGLKPEDLGESFQFRFVYRSDGAILVEGYYELSGSHPYVHYKKTTLSGDRLESVDLLPDRLTRRLPVRIGKGAPDTLPGERIPPFFFTHILSSLKMPEDLSYSFHGWETGEGHDCLVVSLDQLPRSLNPKTLRRKLWIDLARGGHPLRVDVLDGENLLERYEQVRLAEYRSSQGRQVWIPVSCKYSSYNWKGRFYSDPVFSGSASTVNGSVAINQGVSDSTFSVASKTLLPETPALKRMQQRLREQAEASKPKTDPASVASELDRRLAAADQQSRELTASAPSRSWWPGTAFLQAGAGIMGLGVLLFAFRLSRRGGL